MESKKNLIAMSAFVAVALGLAACSGSRPPLRVTTVIQGCAKKKRPKYEGVETSSKIPANCPADLVCYTEDDHAVLERGLLQWRELETWAAAVEISCGTKKAIEP